MNPIQKIWLAKGWSALTVTAKSLLTTNTPKLTAPNLRNLPAPYLHTTTQVLYEPVNIEFAGLYYAASFGTQQQGGASRQREITLMKIPALEDYGQMAT